MAQRKASVWRAARALVILLSIPLSVQYLARKMYNSAPPQLTLVSSPPDDVQQQHEANLTIWEILQSDERVSKFADIVGKLPDIVRGLSTPQARFTVYAPVNEAFDSFYFPPDPPPFFGLFIAGYHMGPGPVPAERLGSMATVSSFVNGDIFFTYKQRISIQHSENSLMLNHESRLLPTNKSQSDAVNGFIHHIDTVLVLPNSTAHAFRTRPELSKLREGLESTRLAESIYDTNAHISQTIFAPTNAAFDRLGKKATKFLFSHGGSPYLRALLKYHIVANKTMFSDVYWPHDGAELVDLAQAEAKDFHEFNLPTLHENLDLQVHSRKDRRGWKLSILAGGEGNDTSHYESVPVSVSDVLVMDGVIHLIDSVLLPPAPVRRTEGSWLGRLASTIGHQGLSVEDLIDRLEPYIE